VFVLAHLFGALSTLMLQGVKYKKAGTLILYHSKRQISTPLCAISVFSVSQWLTGEAHHGDTENTEIAQRKP